MDAIIQATHYQRFPDFSDWIKQPISTTSLEVLEKISDELKQASSETRTRAIELVRNVAAVETGAIEDLYQSDRGMTITAATQIAVLEHIGRDHGEKIRSYIESQIDAYQLVLDFATKKLSVSATWIRQLHQSICQSQDTYEVWVVDKFETRPLPKGEYKLHPNHVIEKDGGIHYYAEPVDVSPEIQRLVDQLQTAEFEQAHPVEQASYAHYALTAVHPFADGNGRVARSFASLYVYRAYSLPLLIYAKERDEYFASLATADNGEWTRFKRFMQASMLRAGRLVSQTFKNAARKTAAEALVEVGQMYYTSGGYLQVEVDERAIALLRLLHNSISSHLGKLKANISSNADISGTLKLACTIGGGDAKAVKESYRRPIQSHNERMISIVGKTAPPAESAYNITIGISLPRDATADDFFVFDHLGTSDSIEIPLGEVMDGRMFEAEMLADIFADRMVSAVFDHLISLGRESLAKRGFGVTT